MKVKNRRSSNRIIVSTEELDVRDHECSDSSSGRTRKTPTTSRNQRCSKSTDSTTSSGAPDFRKNKRKGAADGGICRAISGSFKATASLQSTSSSSASSMLSAEAPDPYEFAVKPEDEVNGCVGDANLHLNTASSSVPPIKKIKLDRMDDSNLPDSARSSPFPQTAFNQPSPSANSSPFGGHCTRPLSVLTDFSGSSASSSSSASCSSLANRSSREQENPAPGSGYGYRLNGARASITSRTTTTAEHRDELSPSALSMCPPARTSVTPVTPPEATGARSTLPPLLRDAGTPQIDTSPPPSSGIPSPAFRQPCSVTCSTPEPVPARRCVGVNTVLDSCKETTIEPDLLGPCEPGTTIRLNGIVWLETTTGVLVVNVTWRGRTYIGTLLDATQHDFAPPCPRDYVPPFKQSVRSSNRSKRRTAFANGYKPHYGSSALGQESNRKGTAVGGTQRHRLRGKNTNSPTSVVPANETVTTNHAPLTTTSGTGTNADNGEKSTSYLLEPGEKNSPAASCQLPKDHCNRKDPETAMNEEVNGTRSLSGGEVVTDSSPGRLDETKPEKVKHKISGCCGDGNLGNTTDLSVSQLGHTSKSDSEAKDMSDFLNRDNQKPPALIVVETNNRSGSPIATSTSGEKCIHKDNDGELETTFPIVCPLDGCKKRFTHVTALRFHLNHTRHANDDKTSRITFSLEDACHSTDLNSECGPKVGAESPPTISPPCPRSPTSPLTNSTPPQPECKSVTNGTLTSSPDYMKSGSTTMNSWVGMMVTSCTDDNEHQSSLTSQRIGSQRTSSNVHAAPNFCGLSYDPNGIPPITRTVTAHTVSIPHGSMMKPDPGGLNGIGVTTTKHRPSTGGRSDGGKTRGHCGRVADQMGKSEPQAMNHNSKRNSVSLKTSLDFSNLSSLTSRFSSNTVLSPGLILDNVPNDHSSMTLFTTPLAPVSRDQLVENVSLNNQLLTLPPGVWNFSSALDSHYESQPNRHPQPTFATTAVADPRQQTGAHHVSSTLTLPSRTHQQILPATPTIGPSSFAPSASTSGAHMDCGLLSSYNGCSNSIFRQTPSQISEPSAFYGIPNFLMAAAMTALSTDRMGNSADVPHSYAPGFSSERGSKPSPNNILLAGQLPLTSSQSSSTKSSESAIPNFVSLAPHTQSSTFMLGEPYSTPPFLHDMGSSINGSSDRLDPFKLSAAYFLQQAAAGSQLHSAAAFGQQSS